MNQEPTIVSFSINDTVVDILAQLRWTLPLQIRNQHKLLLFLVALPVIVPKQKEKQHYKMQNSVQLHEWFKLNIFELYSTVIV